MIVRPERISDHDAVFSIHAAAFETAAEAELVNVLRRVADPIVSHAFSGGVHPDHTARLAAYWISQLVVAGRRAG